MPWIAGSIVTGTGRKGAFSANGDFQFWAGGPKEQRMKKQYQAERGVGSREET